jgi:hypothetical protein
MAFIRQVKAPLILERAKQQGEQDGFFLIPALAGGLDYCASPLCKRELAEDPFSGALLYFEIARDTPDQSHRLPPQTPQPLRSQSQPWGRRFHVSCSL